MTSLLPADLPALGAGAPETAFDVDAWRAAVRAQFPALARVHAGRPVAYFDGPGGTQVPRGVAEAVTAYLLHHNANTKWAYPTSAETDRVLAEARVAMADLLGGQPAEIVFGANMTTLAFHLARALGRRMPAGPAAARPLGPGDAIVVTELDHHANIDPWRALAVERGVEVRMARMDVATGTLDVADLARCIDARVRLVAIGAASNALGTRPDVAAVAAMARAVGALTFVDAVHLVPHALVDVAALDVDFLACSAYKFHGPHVGVLWGRGALLAALDVPKVAPAPADAPGKLETGTLNFEGIHGARAAVDFLAALGGDEGPRRARLARGYARLHAAEQALLARLWAGLAAVDGVTLYGPPPDAPRTPTVSFTVGDRPARDVAAALAEQAVFVSHGDFYASTIAERLGVRARGLVRAGCAVYTTADEVDRLVAGVRALAMR